MCIRTLVPILLLTLCTCLCCYCYNVFTSFTVVIHSRLLSWITVICFIYSNLLWKKKDMMKKACNFVEYIAAIYKVMPAHSVLEVQCTDKMMYYCLCDIHIFA